MDAAAIMNIITFAGVLIALISIVVLLRQLKEMQKASINDFLLRLHEEFFWRQSNAEIIKCIEANKKLLKSNGGRFSEFELDNYLGVIELMYLYVQKEMLDEALVKYFFGYYISKTYANPEVNAYIQTCRSRTNSMVYVGIERLASKI